MNKTQWKALEPGTEFRIAELHGKSDDPGCVPAGTLVRVRDYVPAHVQGAHDDSEDCVVVEFDRKYVVTDPDTLEDEIIVQPQAFSLGYADFKRLCLTHDEYLAVRAAEQAAAGTTVEEPGVSEVPAPNSDQEG